MVMSKRSVRPAVKKKSKQNVADPEFEYPVFSPEGACLQFEQPFFIMAKDNQIKILVTFWSS